MNTIKIASKTLEENGEPLFVAEIGANHNGDMDLCRRIVDAAVEAGADVVKFQSWSEESLFSEEAYKRSDKSGSDGDSANSLREEVREYEFTPDNHRQIHEYCSNKDVLFSSSVDRKEAVDLLEHLDVPFYKIASSDINNIRLLKYVAGKGRPVVVSTGMANIAEIENAVDAIRSKGNSKIALLHCISLYPPDPKSINLRNIEMLRQSFDVPVGFSDHTQGISVPLAAISKGACLVEKHFTIDKELPGWDHAVSANPEELSTLVSEGKKVYKALGKHKRAVSDKELDKRKQFRRSAVAQSTMEEGEVVRMENIAFKRPGTGISPDEFEYAEGRRLNVEVESGHLLKWSHLK